MNRYPAPAYTRHLPANLEERLHHAVEAGCTNTDYRAPIRLIFRADDIGVPSRGFSRLVNLFLQHRMPLCLAVVPSWLTAIRAKGLMEATAENRSLWCWHQHGRQHRNFEPAGKKQEFGPARDYKSLKQQISLGRTRLISLLGNEFQPFFTPPWNRCSLEAAQALKDLGFAAISRSEGARPDLTGILPDFPVNVDLHTRKEHDPETGLGNLLSEIERSLASGYCSVMIHHQRMRRNDFLLLDLLLELLTNRQGIKPLLFGDLLELTGRGN